MTAGAGRVPPLPGLSCGCRAALPAGAGSGRALRSPRTQRCLPGRCRLRSPRTQRRGRTGPDPPAERARPAGLHRAEPPLSLRSIPLSPCSLRGALAPLLCPPAVRSVLALSPRSIPLSPCSLRGVLAPSLCPRSVPAMPSPLPPTRVPLAERVPVLLSCALSCAGSALLLCSQALWPELRTRPRQLLLHLSLADLLSALSYFYGVLRDFQGTSWDCVLQGALSTFANTSSFFWTMAIALYLYLSIVRGSPAGQGLLWGFHAVSWGVPLAITVAAVALRKIGYDASNVSVGWCWVNLDAEDRLLWMLLAGKLWEILAYVTLPVLYLLIRKHINRAHAALSEYRPILPAAPALRPRASLADKKLILIPLIFIFLRIWSTVRFVLTLCDSPAVQNPVLVVLHGIGNTFQGGANCILFVLCTRAVRARLLALLCCSPSAELPWHGQGPPGPWQRPQTRGDGDKDRDKDLDVPKPLLPST